MKSSIISNELQVYRYGNGVKLARNDDTESLCDGYNTGYSVHDLSKLPFNIGICDSHNTIQYVNEAGAYSMGFSSVHTAIGKTNSNAYSSKTFEIVLNNCKKVLNKNEIQIVEEGIALKGNKDVIQRLAIRLPLYNKQDKTIGIFNCSIMLGKQSLPDALSHIKNLIFFNPAMTAKGSYHLLSYLQTNKHFLTKRELQVAYHLIRGKTAKIIAKIFQLSPRTVETHLENMKIKLAVDSKTALIEKLIDGML